MFANLRISGLGRTAGAVLLLALFVGASRAQDGLSIRPSPDVDERLFLLRALETMQGDWALSLGDAETTAQARTEALKLRQRIVDAKLGDEMELLFTDQIEVMDAFDRFVVNLGRIEKGEQIQAAEDAAGAGFRAGATGAVTYDALLRNDVAGADAAGVAVAVGAVQMLYESWKASEARDAAKQDAVQAEVRKLQDRITAMTQRAKATARRLETQYGWKPGEAGFDLAEREALRIVELLDSGDVAQLTPLVQSLRTTRFRDPILRIFANSLEAADEKADPQRIFRCARDCVAAAEWVPGDPVYDDYRTACLATAAELAIEGRTRELLLGNNPTGSTECGRFAVQATRELLARNPRDSDGLIRRALATSLLNVSELEESKRMIEQLVPVLRGDSEFCYLAACLQCRLGDLDGSLQLLRHAATLGPVDLSFAKRDPRLAELRRQRAEEFTEATEVRWTWRIVYGIFNDDIVVTNKSTFALTKVVVQARLEQDDRVWTPELQVDSISPGQSYTWSNVVSIPSSRLTKASAVLICDQNPDP